MSAPPSTRLHNTLQTAVQAVQWTYSLFWQLCPEQGILVWGDGYYNGAIKTRKTVQPMEVSVEETSLQRSQQLRELYDSLSAGESNQQARRPCAALSPEDLTESEWFYLMCVSFTFPPGVGLPGRAYAKRQHVWLTGANQVDSKVFSRAILAKSARVQTVLCIPLPDGVVELGTTERVQEDVALVQKVKSFFTDDHPLPQPKPALSEHSTSNPATSSDHASFRSPSLPAVYAAVDPSANASQIDGEDEEEDNDDEEEDESDCEADTGRDSSFCGLQNVQNLSLQGVEPSELMQLDMSLDIRLGSPDDGCNNLDSGFQLLAVGHEGNAGDHKRRADSCRAESTRRWPLLEEDPLTASFQPTSSELTQEDTHYSQTVSTILHYQSSRWAESSSSTATGNFLYSSQSAFSQWVPGSADDPHHYLPVDGTSQWFLKYILFSVPFIHAKFQDYNSPKSREPTKAKPQEELSANHVLAERRRREKLNERFIILRSLVPFVTKMDKASILGDTIEYLKQLRKKIQVLEAKARLMESDQRCRSLSDPQGSGVTSDGVPALDKRKMRIVEGIGGEKTKVVDSPLPLAAEGVTTQVQVSIIESNALVELQCPCREGLLLDVMVLLRELGVEVTAIQSSLTNGVFVAELRARVKEIGNGRKASIVEVKRAIRQIIPGIDD